MVDYLGRDEAVPVRAFVSVALADGGTALAPVMFTELVGVSGSVTINVDEADLAALGATNVAAYTDGTGAAVGTLVALGKGEYVKLEAIRALLAALPLPTGAATQTTLAAILAKLIANPATETSLAAVLAKLPTLGTQAAAASLSVTPSTDQDPIFDHAHGTKTAVTVSAAVITPPAGCKFIRISTDVDVFVNTAGNAAVDDGTSIRLIANVPEVIPVTAGTNVLALSSAGAATVRCTPLMVR
jgi:hypothetical protein